MPARAYNLLGCAAGNRFTGCCYNRISSVFAGPFRAGGWENLPVLSALQFCATSSIIKLSQKTYRS